MNLYGFYGYSRWHMFRAGILDGKWTGKDGKTGRRELGSKDGKVARDWVPISRFPVHFPFSLRPVYIYCRSFCVGISNENPGLLVTTVRAEVDFYVEKYVILFEQTVLDIVTLSVSFG
jgi:hypothetical protein